MTETDDPADLGEVDTDDIDSEDEAGVVPAPVDDYKNGVDSRRGRAEFEAALLLVWFWVLSILNFLLC